MQNAMINGIAAGMSTTITIDAAGRLILPKAMRERLHLRAGSKLRADLIADRIELTPAADQGAEVARRGRRLVVTGARSAIDPAEAIRADREERLEHLRHAH